MKSNGQPLCLNEVGKRKLIGAKYIQMFVKKMKVIRDRLNIAQERKMSYPDMTRKDVVLKVGDLVFLKLLPCE